MDKKYFIVIFVLLISSCAINKDKLVHEINPTASDIKIVEYLKPGVKSNLKEIDMIKCELGANYKTIKANLQSCYNDLKNQAIVLKGDLIYLDPSQQVIGGNKRTIDNVIRVKHFNVVKLKGIVYRFKKKINLIKKYEKT